MPTNGLLIFLALALLAGLVIWYTRFRRRQNDPSGEARDGFQGHEASGPKWTIASDSDTPQSIAARHGLNYTDIMRWNNLKVNPDEKIGAGRKIFLEDPDEI